MKALPTPRKQKGAVLILVTVALFTLLGFAALALDGGYLILNKNRLQDAVDTAALSGGKTLSSTDLDKSTHDEARRAVRDTLKATFEGDGFRKMNVDTTKLADTVTIEFSHNPVPFEPTLDADAKYIRVRMETVPVTQFLSQLLVDTWQVRASAVAGNLPPIDGNEICDVIPLLMLVDSNKAGEGDFYGYNMASTEPGNKKDGDMIVIKSPAGGNPNMAPGNFQALRLGEQNGADGYRDGLAGGHCITLDEDYEVDECPESEPNCTLTVIDTDSKTGNMAGPTRQGLNTRFNNYNPGKYKAPTVPVAEASPGDENYYSDCSLVKSGYLVDFKDNKLTEHLEDLFNDGSAKKTEIDDYFQAIIDNPASANNDVKEAEKYKGGFSGVQTYNQYSDKSSPQYEEYNKNGKNVDCIDGRRIVKVPVAVGGEGVGKNIPIIGVACMFLNQEVTGNGLSQYVVGEIIPECDSDATGGDDDFGKKPQLVLYNDIGSGDS
ncbi:TadE/TadG family type IV pilus assembly protein [Oceanimonas smirnovii]|uniref:TadE/TadG family type IV pilus assembly protein n=1 Tax=Oceanimonas smirnovii TaxID=264574 RepID=UPI00035E4564|nr:TadE/TadG family type IV pilus assembly protein [Oceanimonas smirnovii]